MAYRQVKDSKEVVVFFKATERAGIDHEAYEALVKRMNEIVRAMPGFISIKPYEGEDGEHFWIIRFESEAALDAWRSHPEHREAQRRGRDEFYESYWIQVCRVLREYEFKQDAKATSGKAT